MEYLLEVFSVHRGSVWHASVRRITSDMRTIWLGKIHKCVVYVVLDKCPGVVWQKRSQPQCHVFPKAALTLW